MHTFLQRMKTEVKGTLSGLDRVRFRGTNHTTPARAISSIRWMASVAASAPCVLRAREVTR